MRKESSLAPRTFEIKWKTTTNLCKCYRPQGNSMEGSRPRDPWFQGVRSRPAFLFVLEDLWMGPIGPMGIMCSAWILAGAAGCAVIKGLPSDQTVEHEYEHD